MELIDEGGEVHVLARLDAGALEAATGWALKPEGLCRGDVCVPLLGRVVERDDGAVDLVEWAAALGLLLALDEERAIAAVTPPASGTRLEPGTPAPDLELPDLDGAMQPLRAGGAKTVLVTWASWCGCRHELAAWQALQDELGPAGLRVYSVALDASPDDARPWIEAAAPTYPVVVDTAHVTAERFGITNVPSTVWIDEDGAVVKPPTIAPGDDQFRDFTGKDAAVHHDALRRWVHAGERPDTEPAANAVEPRTDEQQRALGHRRIAARLHERGDDAGAAVHLRIATELAPWDWTIRRAGIQLLGGDPFLGDEFLEFWQQWDAAGRPGYG